MEHKIPQLAHVAEEDLHFALMGVRRIIKRYKGDRENLVYELDKLAFLLLEYYGDDYDEPMADILEMAESYEGTDY